LLSLQDSGSHGFKVEDIPGPVTGSEGAVRTQVLTTAQCLTALLSPGEVPDRFGTLEGAFNYIDEAKATPDGWGYFPGQRPITEVTAWVLIAHAKGLSSGLWWSSDDRARIQARLGQIITCILNCQARCGGFCPTDAVSGWNTRTYTSAMALWSLIEAASAEHRLAQPDVTRAIAKAVDWFLSYYHAEHGWTTNLVKSDRRPRTMGLNAQVLFILTHMESLRDSSDFKDLVARYDRHARYEMAKLQFLKWAEEAAGEPYEKQIHIGSDHDMHLDGTDVQLERSKFLAVPWSFAALHNMSELMDGPNRAKAKELRDQFAAVVYDQETYKATRPIGWNGTWELAENLLCFSILGATTG
jgi:hypothetical protein